MRQGDANIYLIRHVESALNLQEHIICGRSNDCPISEEIGAAQGQELGRALRDQDLFPDRVFTSPAVRAMTTAQLVLGELGVDVEPVVHDGLQEMDQGEWTGRNRREIYTDDVIAQINERPKDFKGPGAESMNDVELRMYEGWLADALSDTTQAGDRPENIFAFGHGLAIRCLVGHIERWPRERILKTHTPNASVTMIAQRAGVLMPQYVGVTAQELQAITA